MIILYIIMVILSSVFHVFGYFFNQKILILSILSQLFFISSAENILIKHYLLVMQQMRMENMKHHKEKKVERLLQDMRMNQEFQKNFMINLEVKHHRLK